LDYAVLLDYPTLAATRRNIYPRHPLADFANERARDYSTTLMVFVIAMLGAIAGIADGGGG
jgi:hypothetical protein